MPGRPSFSFDWQQEEFHREIQKEEEYCERLRNECEFWVEELWNLKDEMKCALAEKDRLYDDLEKIHAASYREFNRLTETLSRECETKDKQIARMVTVISQTNKEIYGLKAQSLNFNEKVKELQEFKRTNSELSEQIINKDRPLKGAI